jgi:hypothetical protein
MGGEQVLDTVWVHPRIGMLAPWTSVPLTAIIGVKRGNKEVQKEVRRDVEPAPREEIHVGGDQARRRTKIW